MLPGHRFKAYLNPRERKIALFRPPILDAKSVFQGYEQAEICYFLPWVGAPSLILDQGTPASR
jgi:hypothetical protein